MKNEHGANIFKLAEDLNIDKIDILDFSSNINPLSASEKSKLAIIENIDLVSLYPDPEYKELKESISSYSQCNVENILLGSGATELIRNFIAFSKAKKALLLSPVYSEYEKELEKNNCTIKKIYYKKENNFNLSIHEILNTAKDCDLIVICNPNNPTGALFDREQIEKITQNFNGYLMIDETYIEFTDLELYSSVDLVKKYKNIFVIRGTSKFFATPGIRLGYAIAPKDIVENLEDSFSLWNINIFATIMGETMFKDIEYITYVKNTLTEWKKNFYSALTEIPNLKIYPSGGNFILCEIMDNKSATNLQNYLLKKGMIIRNCSSFPGLNEKFFRVCILKDFQNKELINNIKEFMLSEK